MNTELIPQNGRDAVLLQNPNVLAESRFVEDDERAGLRNYRRLLGNYKRTIVTCFFGAIAATAIATLVMTPIYTAETTVLIEPKDPEVVNIKQVQALPESLSLQDYDYYKTQFSILKSRALVAQVIQEQRLDKNPVFTKGLQRRGRIPELWNTITKPVTDLWSMAIGGVRAAVNWLFSGEVPKGNNGYTGGIDSRLIDRYEGMLKIEPVTGTRLVKIAFSSPDPELSTTVANAHARAYIRQGLKLRSKASEEAQNFLEAKLAELRKRVEASEAALNKYRREKGILFLNDKDNVVVERLADLNKRLTAAEAERIGVEAEANLIKKHQYDSLPAVISNSLIQTLKAQVVQLEAEHAKLAAQFLPGYPRLAQVAAQLKEAKSRLAAQIRNVVQGINSAYSAAAGKEKELRAEMDKQKSETLEMKDAAVQYAILAREADTNNQLYNSVLARLKEVGVAGEIPASNVSVIDSATAPETPSWPKKTRNLLLGAIVGLMGGLGLALISEYFDNTLKTPRDVEGYLRLPSLAVVPDFFSLPALGSSNQRVSRQQLGFNSNLFVSSKKLTDAGPPLAMLGEAYRKLRTSIFLSRPGEPPKTILFTSATNGEGKTITAANTAIMLAQMEMQVLVIDADLRKPSCHKAFRVGGGRGLTDYLTGREQLVNAIKPTSVPNVSVLNCGSMPSNPTELVCSKKMQETVANLRERYDFILIDAPPIMPVSDAVILSRMVDGVVLVVRGQETEKQLAKEALSQLGTDSGNILGVVLNRVDIRGGDYSGYTHYYYPHFYAPEVSSET